MTDEGQSALFITKTNSIARLLNASIKMHFRNDDVLAVHCVAHSCLNSARELLRLRGKDIAVEAMKYGLLEAIKRDADDDLDVQSGFQGDFVEFIKSLPEFVRNAATESDAADRIELNVDMGPFWREYKKTYNFLKHADRDSQSTLNADEIDNEKLITYANVAAIELNIPISVEQQLFNFEHNVLTRDPRIRLTEEMREIVRILHSIELGNRYDFYSHAIERKYDLGEVVFAIRYIGQEYN